MKAPLVVLFTLCAFAQSTRDAYREAYRAWVQADPSLEAEAGTTSLAALKQRAEALSQQAARFSQARSAFFSSLNGASEQNGEWLRNTAKPEEQASNSANDVKAIVLKADQSLTRNIEAFAGDADRGIQQVRQALERERLALRAVETAMDATEKAASAANASHAAIEIVRLKAMDGIREAAQGWKQAAEAEKAEGAQWAAYYQKLGDSSASPGVAPPTNPVDLARSEPPTRQAPPIPMSANKFVGAWVFPIPGGSFHGAQPESVTLVVHEDNGRLSGSLTARFKVPAGGIDPNVRFEFSGDMRDAPNEVLPLIASDGGTGTIELIPGGAINLLEVYFRIQKSGKTREGNMLLLKQ